MWYSGTVVRACVKKQLRQVHIKYDDGDNFVINTDKVDTRMVCKRPHIRVGADYQAEVSRDVDESAIVDRPAELVPSSESKCAANDSIRRCKERMKRQRLS